MFKTDHSHVCVTSEEKNVSSNQRISQSERDPQAMHCYQLYVIFSEFREKNQHKQLIDFLVEHYPSNVKNKTFNFQNTGHLFHSLYAYVPSVTNAERERKQIRLSTECIHKLFVNTINDFKMYGEIFDLIHTTPEYKIKYVCPCQIMLDKRDAIQSYVDKIKTKKFDSKPPKLKKEPIDNIMYKYSLNWKNLLMKKKYHNNSNTLHSNNNIATSSNSNVTCTQTSSSKTTDVYYHNSIYKKKRRLKKRNILTDELILFKSINSSLKYKLYSINGMSLRACQHSFVTVEKQTRAGDEIVSFIKYCQICKIIATADDQ
uniref:Late expression factor 5 n=1 Tax=Helicoverpa armigera nucleopolyhedrovirus TaxID=51313 RepID=A0A0E3JA26_9ABAC|nr:late expression factor 5 [Helicoverpa armigera nucleopolyhedrovirus]